MGEDLARRSGLRPGDQKTGTDPRSAEGNGSRVSCCSAHVPVRVGWGAMVGGSSVNDRKAQRTAMLLTTGVALGALGLLAFQDQAIAGARGKKAAVIGLIETPLGLQGRRGAGENGGGNVIIPFRLVDPSRAATDVEMQFARDLNADGQILDDEYVPAT